MNPNSLNIQPYPPMEKKSFLRYHLRMWHSAAIKVVVHLGAGHTAGFIDGFTGGVRICRTAVFMSQQSRYLT